MNPTKIEWCDYTWNPMTGCKHGCSFCYARKLANGRLKGRYGYDRGFEPTFHENRLFEPLKLKKPARIFVCSMGDLFGEWVDEGNIFKILDICSQAPQHTFIFLTKNPKRYYEFESLLCKMPNCWIGTSIESDKDKQRAMDLWYRGSRFNLKFLSIEPIHGLISPDIYKKFDWIIVGAESGGRKVRIYPTTSWVMDIEWNCLDYKIPLFIKDNINYERSVQEFPKGKAES